MLTFRILEWALKAILNWAFTLLCYFPLNFIAPLFADEKGWLPKWLSWIGTFDASLDAGWKDGYFSKGTKPWSLWWARVRWLMRNPAYGFDYQVLGIPFKKEDWKKRFFWGSWGDAFVAKSSSGHFNFTCNIFGQRFKLGWKAWNYFDAEKGDWKENYQWGPEMKVPLASSIPPWLFAIPVVFLLCGCGGGEPEDSGNVPMQSPPPVEWRKPPADPCLNTHPCHLEPKK